MSVEPVTVVITLTASEFGADIDSMARKRAAEELGLDESQIMCIKHGPALFQSETLSEPNDEGARTRLAEPR